jgi:hypothetical protein
MISSNKKSKINLDSVQVKIVVAGKENPNKLNPYINLTPKAREEVIVSICGRIWSRHIREKLSQNNSEGKEGTNSDAKPVSPLCWPPAAAD